MQFARVREVLCRGLMASGQTCLCVLGSDRRRAEGTISGRGAVNVRRTGSVPNIQIRVHIPANLCLS